VGETPPWGGETLFFNHKNPPQVVKKGFPLSREKRVFNIKTLFFFFFFFFLKKKKRQIYKYQDTINLHTAVALFARAATPGHKIRHFFFFGFTGAG